VMVWYMLRLYLGDGYGSYWWHGLVIFWRLWFMLDAHLESFGTCLVHGLWNILWYMCEACHMVHV
jgi:hypothetical protein